MAPQKTTPAVYDWSQHKTTGLERVTQQDLGIPFLQIVQAKSPEVDKTHKNYAMKKIPGCQVGDIINTNTRQVLFNETSGPIEFIPCLFEKIFVEWKPREQGGGMVRVHHNPNILLECTRNERNRDILPGGNTVVTTCLFHGVVLLKDGTTQQVTISLTSTQLKKARAWLNMITGIRVTGPDGRKIVPPMFSHKYLLSSTPESNSDGTWYGWKIETGPMIAQPETIAQCLSIAQTAGDAPKQLGTGDED